MWVSTVFTAFLLAGMLCDVVGPASVDFVNWVQWVLERFKSVIEDLDTLLRVRVPSRPGHPGLAAPLPALGLLVFLWLGLGDLLLTFTIPPGTELSDWPQEIKELHEIGKILVPA